MKGFEAASAHRGPNLMISPESLETSMISVTRELVFQFGNTGLVDFLLCLGGLIFRILRQVGIVGDRFLNALNETRSLDPNAVCQLIFKGRMTSGGHGELVHRCSHPLGDEVAVSHLFGVEQR